MIKEEIIKSAKDEVLGCEIEHSNLGHMTIKDIRAGSDYLMVKLVQNNGNEREMAVNFILDKLSDSVVKDNLENYSNMYVASIKEERDAIRKAQEAEREAIAKAKELKKREEGRQRYIERITANFKKMKLTLDDYEKMDEEEVFLREHCSITAGLPDFLENYFMSQFPNSHPRIADSSKLTVGGYLSQWAVSAKINIRKSGRDCIPATLRKFVNDKYEITDTQLVLGLCSEYDLEIGGRKI